MYFWWPKIFGYFLSEKLGKIHFWISLVGFNLTFGPMHVLGIEGMSRRIPTYNADSGFQFWNLLSTIGAFTIAVSLLVFFVNIATSYAAHRKNPVNPGPDPWDSRSIEWMIPSPTPEHNFDTIPTITEFDHFWHLKYGHNEEGRSVRIANTADVVQDGSAKNVHLPSPSYWPIILAAGMPFIGYGVIYNAAFAVPGVILVLAGMVGWLLEPPDDVDLAHAHEGDHHESDSAAELASVAAADVVADAKGDSDE